MTHPSLFGCIAELFHAGKNTLTREFQAAGLPYPATYLKITRLIDRIQPCTAQTLVQTLQRDKAQIALLLNDMEKHGLIARKPNPADRRSQLLSLSAKGRSDFAAMQAIESRVLTQMRQGLSADELAALMQALQRVRTNLD